MWGQGGASDFVLCFGVWGCVMDNCIGFGGLLFFGIIVLVFGRCFVFCGIEGLKS